MDPYEIGLDCINILEKATLILEYTGLPGTTAIHEVILGIEGGMETLHIEPRLSISPTLEERVKRLEEEIVNINQTNTTTDNSVERNDTDSKIKREMKKEKLAADDLAAFERSQRDKAVASVKRRRSSRERRRSSRRNRGALLLEWKWGG